MDSVLCGDGKRVGSPTESHSKRVGVKNGKSPICSHHFLIGRAKKRRGAKTGFIKKKMVSFLFSHTISHLLPNRAGI